MTDITREQFIDGLVSQHGVLLENAERMADLKFGPKPVDESDHRMPIGVLLSLPIRLVLPWSALCSDNDKSAPAMRQSTTGKAFPVIILTGKYRQAKQAARKIGVEAMTVDGRRADPLEQPLKLTARVWVPDNRPGHDVANFAKCAHDALEKVVYTKDELLHDVRWVRAGVDVDRPRAELLITLVSHDTPEVL